VLVPRHVERTPEVERELRERGLSHRLLEPPARAPSPSGPADVLLVNTTGELMNFYALSDIVFVGKSLAGNAGGHNIIEPAIFAKPILHGTEMQNFREVADLFQAGKGAVQLTGDGELAAAMRKLLADPEERRALGERARAVVDRHRGSIDRTLDVVLPLLPGGA
jgi:3-deoxy-D-manno-octulosonic-acid transferase